MRKTEQEIIAETPSGETPNIFPEYEGLTESQLDEIFFMDAYNLAVSDYENRCSEESTYDIRSIEETAEKFFTALGLNTSTIDFTTVVNEETAEIVIVGHQKIGNQKGPKTVEVSLNYDGGIIRANGLSYELVERATVETLSPAESIERTIQANRIVGAINHTYFEEYNLITTISPKNEQTVYEMNRSENIIVTIATIDGYLAVPGYILYNNVDKTGIYVVALPEKYLNASN